MPALIGKKKQMAAVFSPDGTRTPATVLAAGPCVVVGARTKTRDGYTAVVLGYGFRKRVNKPLSGTLKQLGSFRLFREFRSFEDATPTIGSSVDVGAFTVGEKVSVVGTSKGHGFQGVVKRHGFHGHPPTHGHKDAERMPGSSGAGGMQRVIPGKRMPGRMGGNRVTVSGLTVLKVDTAKNELWVSGAVPGARGGVVLIRSK
jgi:large subunit ribosomal protein L3